jgi:hypothetical protein
MNNLAAFWQIIADNYTADWLDYLTRLAHELEEAAADGVTRSRRARP